MTTELVPLGVQCNLSCAYCYQTPMRDAGNVGNDTPYDFAKMFKALEEEGTPFSVFGGEALLIPLADLCRIWAFGLERYKQNGIQTNGVLITPAHIQAFKQYNVHVGFSLDGPGELNDSRWAGTLEKTRLASVKSHANLAACIAAGVGTSVIITLYRGNADQVNLPRLKVWIRALDDMGTRGVRIHLLEIDHPQVKERMQLTQGENITALRELAELEKTLPHLKLDIFTDMRKLLQADDEQVTCIWSPCDPYTTSAVRGVDGQGNKSNCGRTNKDGVARLKAERPGFERQLALYDTSQTDGGCQGCRFFLMCKGQCPGTAIDGDPRNRSSDCQVWFTLFEDLEAELVNAGQVPLSLDPRRPKLEQMLLTVWGQGRQVSLKAALRQLEAGGSVDALVNQGYSVHGDHHGDHTDRNRAGVAPVEHGDSPHGDAHGDHVDQSEEQ